MLPVMANKEFQIPPDLLKQADETVGVLQLVTGTLEDGDEFYAYVVMSPSGYAAFMKVKDKGGYNLEDYGEIVAAGEGLTPSPEVAGEMRDLYGADPQFEEKLVAITGKVVQDYQKEERVFKKFGVRKKKNSLVNNEGE